MSIDILVLMSRKKPMAFRRVQKEYVSSVPKQEEDERVVKTRSLHEIAEQELETGRVTTSSVGFVPHKSNQLEKLNSS